MSILGSIASGLGCLHGAMSYPNLLHGEPPVCLPKSLAYHGPSNDRIEQGIELL